MRIVALTSPGRFPTVVNDPGRWWTTVESAGHELTWHQANTAWWHVLCSPGVRDALLAPLSLAQRIRRRIEWKASGLDLKASAVRAGHSLEALHTPAAYADVSRYVAALTPVVEHLDMLNAAQGELRFSLEQGVKIVGLDCGRSAALAQYARQDGILSATIRAALAGCPSGIDLLVVTVTSVENLLAAMIAVRHLRVQNPGMHVCLADHGYENFSLGPHLERLRAAGVLTEVFDTLIVSQGDRDVLLPALVEALAAGRSPHGFLTRTDLACTPPAAGRYRPPRPPPTFSSEPVFWTRVSPARCYWGRCAFCVQNNKHQDPRAPAVEEVPAALDRIESLLDAGYRTLIFSDEALSPALVRRFCEGVLERGLSFRWSCRCRMEPTFDRELFALMRKAGCYEVLYGLESVSPRMQERMRKCAAGLPSDRVRDILRAMNDVGLGVHVNLLAAFPGDTPAEFRETIDFCLETLAGAARATFTLNRFALFPGTPVMNEPEQFGVVVEPAAGDMPSCRAYRLVHELQADEEAVDALVAAGRERLLDGLGWQRLGAGPGPAAAVALYFDSGHGALFKQREHDPFLPILQSTASETSP